MSTPTLSDLLVSNTQDEWTAIALAALQGKNFPTTDWTSTSPERAMLETDTACLADQSTQIPLIVQLVLAYYAQASSTPSAEASSALQFLAHYWYEIDAFAATAAVGTATLSCNSTSGPYTIAVNQLIATDGAGHLYTNTTDGTLAASGTLSPTWQALTTGAGSSVNNNTITSLQTPLPGVTINNPGPTFSPVTHTGSGTGTVTPSGASPSAHSWIIRIDTTGAAAACTWSYSTNGGGSYTTIVATAAVTPGGTGTTLTLAGAFIAGDTYTFSAPGSWLTTQGTNLESTYSLATRCLARWAALADVPTTDVYTKWALESGAGQVTRVNVETDPSVAATVNVYIAGPTSTSSAAQVNVTQAYINVRAPLTDLPVIAAAPTTNIALAGTAYYPAAKTGVPADRNAAIVAYCNSLQGNADNPSLGTIECAEVIALALNLNAAGVPTGATNIVSVDVGAGVMIDYVLSANNIAVVTNNIIWTAV